MMVARALNDKNKGIRSNKVKDLIQASYQRNGPAENIGRKYGLNLDSSLSNAEQKVYVYSIGNPTIAYTGSRKIKDWGSNALLAVGLEKYSTRFRDAKKTMDSVKRKYSGKPITTLGHSLGGSLAEYAGGDKVITIDKGVGLTGIGKRINKNQTDIRASNDVVSVLSNTQRGGRKITIKDKANLNPLTAHNYRQLSKLNNKIL
jgi:hypothetical protein